MKSYDADVLANKLSNLTARGRSAFACSCAERGFRPIEAYLQEINSGRVRSIRASLDAIWVATILDSPLLWPREQTRAILGVVPRAPDDDRFERWTSANTAAPAIIYAAWSHKSHRARTGAWAGSCIYEMFFYAAEDFLGHQPLDVLNSSDLVQLELTRQEDDFLALQQADVPQTYMNLKAQSESIDVLSEFKNGKGPCYFR